MKEKNGLYIIFLLLGMLGAACSRQDRAELEKSDQEGQKTVSATTAPQSTPQKTAAIVLAKSGEIRNIRPVLINQDFNQVPVYAGKRILIESGDDKNDRIALSEYGSDLTYLGFDGLRHLENPRPLSDQNTIIFSAIGKNGNKGIYQYNLNAISLFKTEEFPQVLLSNAYNNSQPSLVYPDLAYVSDASGKPQIHLYNLKNKQDSQISNLTSVQSPYLDAQKEWIYFSAIDGSQNYDIYRIRLDGTRLTRLTSSADLEYYPVLTHYEKWILYTRRHKEQSTIRLRSVNGKIDKQISGDEIWAQTAFANQEGTRIVFEGIVAGKRGIFEGELDLDLFKGATTEVFNTGMDVNSEVINIDQYGALTQGQIAKLSRFGFFLRPTTQKQLFFIYDNNYYENIPSFVSADVLLHLLHVLFDTNLRLLEIELLSDLQTIASGLLKSSEKTEGQTMVSQEAISMVRRYLAVLQLLVNGVIPTTLTADEQQAVQAEMAKISSLTAQNSSLFSLVKLDYSMFKVRGHYEMNTQLHSYFQAMMWLGTVPFQTESPEQLQFIYLLAALIDADPNIKSRIQKIYDVSSYFVGESDDPGILDFIETWNRQQGTGQVNEQSYSLAKTQQCLAAIFSAHQARIRTFYVDANRNQEQVLYFMGQRYVPDSHLFSHLFAELGPRFLPLGIDVFVAMDNRAAITIRTESEHIMRDYPLYPEIITKSAGIFDNLNAAENKTLFTIWVNLLKTYTNSADPRIPTVFQTEHWQKKKLQSALGSWAELKHDTILYAKQTGAQMGGMETPPQIHGYLEPELTLYLGIRDMLVQLDQFLKNQGTKGVYRLAELLEFCDFFINITQKQLDEQPLAEEEIWKIQTIGGWLESLTLQALGVDEYLRWFELESEGSKNMAVIADVLSYWGQYLLEGVGYADEIYIIVPANDQLVLMKGAVFSYYEFLNDTRLSDGEWYETLPTIYGDKTQRPAWMQAYFE